MLALMEKPVRVSRVVEDEGLHCPVRLAIIDPRICEPCRFLSHTIHDDSGAITSLICAPSIGAMLKGS
jgi:hypothetical protein